MPDTKTETGPTWTGYFPKGNIGIMPMPASLQGMANAALADEDIGVTTIKGVNGGESTFVGGDAIGISRDSKVADAAWNFMSWCSSDEAQVEVVAKGGNVVARTDLANNQYSSADPRLVIFNTIAGKGQTPFALNFGADVQRPAGSVARAAPRRDLRRRQQDRRRQRRHQRFAESASPDGIDVVRVQPGTRTTPPSVRPPGSLRA